MSCLKIQIGGVLQRLKFWKIGNEIKIYEDGGDFNKDLGGTGYLDNLLKYLKPFSFEKQVEIISYLNNKGGFKISQGNIDGWIDSNSMYNNADKFIMIRDTILIAIIVNGVYSFMKFISTDVAQITFLIFNSIPAFIGWHNLRKYLRDKKEMAALKSKFKFSE